MTDSSKRNSDPAAPSGNPIGRRAAVKFASAIAVLAVIGAFVIHLWPLFAQVPPVTLELLAGGFNPDRRIQHSHEGAF